MIGFSRRSFLKLVGLAATGTAAGCSDPTRYRLPYITPPDSVIPGEPSWFATTCRECPAGCGMLAKNMDTRVIKVEGNPGHPVNKGALCPRGQASLTRLYDPDRIRGPLKKTASGGFEATSWLEADNVLASALGKVAQKKKSGSLVFMTELITGPLQGLVEHWAALAGEGTHALFEPFMYEPLRKANRFVYGRDVIPTYRIDEADFLVSFNAGFLETWLSNVEYARRFASFHEPKKDQKNFFVFVGPRQSLTAANADAQIRVAPGDEYLVGIGLLLVLSEGGSQGRARSDQGAIRRLLDGYSLQYVANRTGVPEKTLRAIAGRFLKSKKPLALAEGLTWYSPKASETAVAANLLNTWNPGSKETILWDQASAQGEVRTASEMKSLIEKMRSGQVDCLIIHGANPVFSLPGSWDVKSAIQSVPTVISLSSFMDETTALAGYVLPAHTPLESWGEFSPKQGITGIMQPVMGALHDTRPLGDILIMSGKKTFGQSRFPWKNFHDLLLLSWNQKWKDTGAGLPFDAFWAQTLRKGGSFAETGKKASIRSAQPSGSFSFPPPSPRQGGDRLHFVAYPTVQFYDGRMADSPWIQELPDPITQTTWGGWAEIHPEEARKLSLDKGDLLEIQSDYGTIRVPALPIYSVDPGTVAVPLGQGHQGYGRFAEGLPDNPMALFPSSPDQPGALPLLVSVRKTDGSLPIAHTDGSFYEYGRNIVETTSLEDYRRDSSSHKKPEITMPLPSGWDPKHDMYPTHVHPTYRWAMVVDLDRCIGCGACVTACYAENNVAFVGRKQILNGREMSWIRVQRYFTMGDNRVHWLVMLCQHCDSAPCESVCPIYAPQHSIEGLNNQVYNRCFGTRFCSQDDPYKVRRFNFFWYTRPWPLSLQLNPDVTVRQMGVMEKCSFCVQRIIDAKIKARLKDRLVKDGDFTTACAQTCPTNALIFGNLKDPESRVSKLIENPRAYQVFRHLNTKPAVIYLKRIEQKLEV